MKSHLLKLIDILIAILFLFAAYSALYTFTGYDINLPIIGVLLAIFYILISFGLLRSIPQVRYLIYINSIIVIILIIGFEVLLITENRFYYPLIIPLIIYTLISWYCYHRFKKNKFNSTIKKEFGFFILMLVVLLAVLVAGSYFFGWGARNEVLSGPISIRN